MARAARRVSRLVVSALLLAAGAAMLVLPGPGPLTLAQRHAITSGPTAHVPWGLNI